MTQTCLLGVGPWQGSHPLPPAYRRVRAAARVPCGKAGGAAAGLAPVVGGGGMRAARPGWPLYSAARIARADACPGIAPQGAAMYYFAYGFKKPIAPLLALQVAQQAMVSAGFTVFDPVAPGKVTLGGTQTQAGVMVTVVAMDCEGGAAVVVNGFCANDLAVDSARSFAENIAAAVNYA